jgi:Protein of unknown function (DUF1592)/Protein of unknown function (DUF1588)/Protein of unknown function (DUF1595)/Protein of unknown function (DUF1585)
MKAKRVLRTSSWLAGGLCAVAVAACGSNGSDANPGAAPMMPTTPGAGATGSPPSGAAGTGSTTMPPITDGPPIAESAGTLVMRRLTYREYDHLLTQLLGDATSPASGPTGWSPDDTAASGFVAPDKVASYHVVQFNQTADALVDAALQTLKTGGKTGKFVLPAGCAAPTSAQESSCATQFIASFGQQAYRRPIAADEQADLLTLFSTVRSADAFTFPEAIGAITKVMLQSPNFLYHWELGPTKPIKGADGLVPLSQWQMASRLASSLWESMPDDTLFAAAQKGELSTPAQVLAQAQRMIADPQAAQSLYSFHLQWLLNMGFHTTDLSAVDPKPASLLTAAAAQGLQTEFTSFISSVFVPPGDGTLNSLYTAPYAFVNKDLAAIYGVPGPATGFAKVSLDPTQRAGIFTQVAFLAGIEDTIADNPIYRGIAVYTKALCGQVPPPPGNIPVVNFVPGGTTRQAFDAHGSSACATACHTLFDPPGFAFENYDGVGQYRTTDGGQPVDATGTFKGPLMVAGMAGGSEFKFNNAVELSKQLAASSEAQSCVDRQWSRYILGRMETAVDAGSLQAAYRSGTATTGFSIRDMLATLLASKAFMYRQPSDGEPI